jgi:hypothetical protein
MKSRGCGDLKGLVYCGSLAAGGELHPRIPIPPCPSPPMAPAARLSRYVTACGRLVSKCPALPAIHSISGPFLGDARRYRCPPSCPPVLSWFLLHLSGLSAHETRQALQAAGSTRCTLRLALTAVARRAREISYPIQPRRPAHSGNAQAGRTYGHHPDPDPAFAATRSYTSRGVCAQGKDKFAFAVGVED